MGMEQSTQAIALHRAFAHLAADHECTAAAVRGGLLQFRSKQRSIFIHHPEHHESPVVTPALTMQAVEAAMAA